MGKSKGALMACLSRDAQKLQCKYPEIAEDYLSLDMTYSQIVDKYRLTNFFRLDGRNDENWAICVVGLAIRGMNGGKYLGSFNGLVPEKIQRKIGRQRRLNNLERWIETNGGNTGFALLSDNERKAVSHAAIEERGRTLALEGEAEKTYELSRQEEYQNSRGVCWKDVSEIINLEMHGGKNVRTPKAVRCMAYKYRKKFS